jgi:hypothetical protein
VTAVSGRLPKERNIAVEMLRGPDHMAMRNVSVKLEQWLASEMSP